ncbi:MAG: HAD-IA family hydrolase [Candidatus Marsarchaeota archaeon]|nr:HAD-IA family hydrolase [Candidatus Marsarchaeota archaeon]
MLEYRILDEFDAFIFDWDGTLSNMRALLRLSDSYKRVFSHKKSIKKYIDAEKFPHSDVTRKMIELEEEKNDFLSVVYDIFFSLSKPKLQKGALEAVKYLRSKRKRLAILTNGNFYRVNRELERTGLKGMFETVVSMRSLGSMKPDPSGLIHLIKRMKVERGRVLYIGDAIDDILVAKYAGVKGCAIADGFDSRATLAELKPDFMFSNMEQFYKNITARSARMR